MEQQASPVVQKKLIGVLSDWYAVAEGADQKLVLHGVGELRRLLEAKVEETFGLECTMRLRPGHFPDVENKDLVKLKYGELPPTPPVLVFESSPNVGLVDAHVKQLRDEKELADLTLQIASATHTKEFTALMAQMQELSGKIVSIENDCTIEKQRQEKRVASLEKRVGYQNQKIENLEHELKVTKDELKDTKDELKDTKDELRESVKNLEEEYDFFTYLHLRSLLDESRSIIASAFGKPKWRAFIKHRDKNKLPIDIGLEFPGSSLSSACIEYLCDDNNPLRSRGNNVAHHKDFAKMKRAIDKVQLPVGHEGDRQHLRSLYQFITTPVTPVNNS